MPNRAPPEATPPATSRWAQLMASGLGRLGGEFLRFGLVGMAGYVVDVAVLRLGLLGGLNLYTARVPSYVAAASTTWWLNRKFTFRHSAGAAAAPARQWAVFVVGMLPGLALNYGTYALLVANVAFCARWPEVAVFAGALAGMGANFAVSKAFIFNR